MSRRRIPKCGRHLPEQDAAPLAEALAPGLHDRLSASGYRLTPTVRPYRRSDGRVTVRLVWRRRYGGVDLTVTATHTVSVEGRAES
ncbi:hypothetical protein [Roseospira navarrensis]|uniref:hypothetical protein n=1 Tax=Roseospira navarrensis TaxID=140058 RepID=UPI00147876D4|nr:hypothetical protein [Roseospira navarrensis]